MTERDENGKVAAPHAADQRGGSGPRGGSAQRSPGRVLANERVAVVGRRHWHVYVGTRTDLRFPGMRHLPAVSTVAVTRVQHLGHNVTPANDAHAVRTADSKYLLWDGRIYGLIDDAAL
ncbi:MAG: hypothetical protein ACR2M1_02610 [Gemmatimonadaceae bacterium]